jgi:hypothetical protein
MMERTVEIVPEAGLHARPASKFVETANQFDCDLQIAADGEGGGNHCAARVGGRGPVAIIGVEGVGGGPVRQRRHLGDARLVGADDGSPGPAWRDSGELSDSGRNIGIPRSARRCFFLGNQDWTCRI